MHGMLRVKNQLFFMSDFVESLRSISKNSSYILRRITVEWFEDLLGYR